ncbi:MAG TPA: MarR family transcriptional regulator [Candidatus Blautia merdavium]|uniref:HTH-type transcriptional regulator SarZ n=1 Tax=Candidatus Blautia merdavium TaxID=2838494 RepID=A0A9D2PKG8_9FIRM|nr:MarR family transcriptional regulator [Candidatus Blautia merdavium]
MDYKELAEEYLMIRAQLLKVPASQQVTKLVKGELFVLNYLATHEKAVYPKDLSKEMVVSTARIAVILNQMEDKKWITRTADTEDNRQILVALTEEGHRVIEQQREKIIHAVVQMFEKLGPEDAAEFIRIQRKIVENR